MKMPFIALVPSLISLDLFICLFPAKPYPRYLQISPCSDLGVCFTPTGQSLLLHPGGRRMRGFQLGNHEAGELILA